MEMQQKQRLVGMAVVIGFFVVVMPMLFRHAKMPVPPRRIALVKPEVLQQAGEPIKVAQLIPQTADVLPAQPALAIPEKPVIKVSAPVVKPIAKQATTPVVSANNQQPVQQPLAHQTPIQQKEPTKVAVKTLAKPMHDKPWAIQLATFRHNKNAQQLIAQLKKQHFNAFMRKIPATNHNPMMVKVLVGPERTESYAQQVAAELYRAFHLHGVIVRL